MELKLKPLSPKLGKEIPLPSYATAGSAGMDLRACIDESFYLPGQVQMKYGTWAPRLVPTGLAIALPGPEYVALVFARSGLATKYGVALANGVGVIDSDYRGEVKVALFNHGWEDYLVQPGERIAQLVVLPVAQAKIIVTDDLDETERGNGGFGSTGKA
ncbi:MAG: dUTP diphosphatase [Pseudoflavonifractor sp.]|nr:dUTP diphosphatase [Pseudoflavonifractor sp.]